ncbi:MAG: EamA family transporter [Spirochaetes bacterium]|nr:EamA family transporter [Spirochaetota bacterium]MBU1079477.1 EamA family transporter [Spirochaetota bacterium]
MSQRGSISRGGPFAVGILAAAILSLTSVLIVVASKRYGLPALVIAVWRDAFTAGVLAVVLSVVAPGLVRAGLSELRYLAFYGFVLACFNVLWTISVIRNGAAAATLLVYASGGFTILIERLASGTRVSPSRIIAAALSFLGAALLSGAMEPGAWRANGAAVAVGIGSALAYAAYSVVGKGASKRGLSPWTSVLYSFAFAAIFLLAARRLPASLLPASVTGPGLIGLPGSPAAAWLVLLVLAAGPTLVGFGLYNVTLAALPAGTANILVSLEPVFTAAIALAFLGERLGAASLLGAACVLGAVAVACLDGRGADPSYRRATSGA